MRLKNYVETSESQIVSPAIQSPADRHPINVRKGVNRIFVVLWVVYGVWILLYPIHRDLQDRQSAFDATNASLQLCFEPPGPGFEWCEQQYQVGMDRDREGYKIGGSWTQFGWHLLWVVPVALCVPPLFVYGCFYGLWRTGRWITRGFATPGRLGI